MPVNLRPLLPSAPVAAGADRRRERRSGRGITRAARDRLRVHCRHPAPRRSRPDRGDHHPARNHFDPGVHRGRHQGHGQGGPAGEHARPRRASRAGQRLPPLSAAGRGRCRRRRRAGRLHELARTHVHRQRRVPGHVARGRLQEGAGDAHRRTGRRRGDRPGQDPTGPGGRRRGDFHLPPRWQPAPVHPGERDAAPSSARGRHLFRLRRVHDLDKHPRLPGTGGAAYAGLGRALPGRAHPADPRAQPTGPTRHSLRSSRGRSTPTCAARPAGT